MKDVHLTVRVTAEQAAALRRVAERDSVPVGTAVRTAIAHYLQERGEAS